MSRQRRRWLMPAVLSLLALLALGVGYGLRPRPTGLLPPLPARSLVVAYLKVGHGEASWVKTPPYVAALIRPVIVVVGAVVVVP